MTNDIPETPYCHHLRKRPLPSIDELRATFSYDPETGILTRIKGRKNAIGTANTVQHGYIITQLNKTKLRAHRVAFALMTGRWPHLLDHRNTIKTDNKWDNLEEVTNGENMRRTSRTPENENPNDAIARRRESQKKWRSAHERNREYDREYNRKRRLANPDKHRERERSYDEKRRAANPEKHREHDRAYRARKKAAAAVKDTTAD